MRFQSTPSQRGRRPSSSRPHRTQTVSIHALAKRATHLNVTLCVKLCCFNPRPRKEGDTGKHRYPSTSSLFQSTPSQRGRPLVNILVTLVRKVSIHALAKRATRFIVYIITCLCVSIHALAKRATKVEFLGHIKLIVSIHALAKRATAGKLWFRLFRAFQSTPSQRGRPTFREKKLLVVTFQSTPSQRGRPQIYTMIIYILKLNITFRTFFLYKIIKN